MRLETSNIWQVIHRGFQSSVGIVVFGKSLTKFKRPLGKFRWDAKKTKKNKVREQVSDCLIVKIVTMIYSRIGLLLDITGVCVVLFYGLPSKFINPFEENSLSIGPLAREEIKRRKNDHKKINSYAYLGLALMLLGFIFQFIGTLDWTS